MFITKFVERPGLGCAGRPIKVKANFFEVTYLADTKIHHYDVIITPEVPPTLNRRIYSQFEALFAGDIKPVFDGRRNIFTARPLPFGDTDSFDIYPPEDASFSIIRQPPYAFKFIIRKVAVIDMNELHKFLYGNCSLSSNILTGIMALNVLIRHQPFLNCKAIGRSFYTNQISQDCFDGVELWQGYRQSIRPTFTKIMINVDVSATVFHESNDLVLIVTKMLGRNIDDLRVGIKEKDRLKLEKSLKYLKIRIIHRGDGSRRSYKILNLTSTSASNTKFDDGDGRIDVASYFLNTHNRLLRYPFLPCVVIKNKTFLPLEVCEVVEGQHHIRKLNERQSADMMKFSCRPPQHRAYKIRQGLDILNYRQNEYMRQFGLEVSGEMTVVPARVLPAPKIHYHHPFFHDTTSFVTKDGSWNLRDKKFVTGVTLGSWACVAFGYFSIQIIQCFIRELVITCQDTGMNIQNMHPPIMQGNPQGNIEEILKQAWLKAGNTSKSHPQLILCILPNAGVPLYAEIKRVCDTIIGVATQCVQSKVVFQAKKQHCANLCLKINVKLGGMNSFIEPSQIPFVSQRPTIIMGASVTHPADESRPSIAALCASMDAKAYRYAASIRIQAGRQAIISDLAGMVKELLETFYQTCKVKPVRILFYRNGVSEDQFEQVFDLEIEAVRNACRSLDANYKPTITFVVAQKRHHVRFFPTDKKDSDRTGNCLIGTVIESTIAHPFEFDFYLQSHAGLQGTSRSTHYHVLCDENRFTPDSLQTLTYNLCYSFVRCTRAVSIVPPVYYARLACSRSMFHLRCENWSDPDSGSAYFYIVAHSRLQNVMYFI
ncbi:4647_t:CDS:2 [Funneliformis geosporum]|uniref:7903_t:CDS:1 n=1 Tax=Funneliformis geosporum TaxID=1117311 RepID=A0A9W4T2B5_9GLOM|nr:7903_t:CDS:2 [Funneliformis geosporum]CAI2189767.1 4647_t:CDS:2 [Funneliformis geosporum]